MFETSLLFNDPPKEAENKALWSNPKLKSIAVITLLVSGIACTAWGTWLFFGSPVHFEQAPDDSLVLLQPQDNSLVFVDVSGAVESPGIYSLKDGERVAAAIEAAGGLSILADSQYIHSSLNLSSRLKDEQKIYVPFVGEQKENSVTTDTAAKSNGSEDDNKVSINSASEAQLDELPKIGPATAEKIIGGRPYSSIDELLSKNSVSEGVFDEIKELIKM